MKIAKTILSLTLSLLMPFIASAQFSLINLKVNNSRNPLGVESSQPMFSWEIISKTPNLLQNTYQIKVFTKGLSPKLLWQSPKVASSASSNIAYQGPALLAGASYNWQVTVSSNKTSALVTSSKSSFSMGLFTPDHWQGAHWIALDSTQEANILLPALHHVASKHVNKCKLPQFRKEINTPKKIASAQAYIAGLGHFDFFINGQKVGNHHMDAGWTQYSKEAQYVVFDVSQHLKQGKNTLAIMLGNGFYNIPNERYWKILQSYGCPRTKALVQITYTDGTTQNIATDPTWKAHESALGFSSIYSGEDFDANLELKGWKNNGFNDSNWPNALLADKNSPALFSQKQEPLSYFNEFLPKKITQPKPGLTVYDLGQNFSGIFNLNITAPKGWILKVRPAELLHDDGTTNQWAVGHPVFFQYTSNGTPKQTWQPQFTYYGFRYLETQWIKPKQDSAKADALATIHQIKGIHTRNAAETVGSFSCSNEQFNQTYKLIDWAMRSNMASVLTDCPHREKLGWLEEQYLMGNSLRYTYNLSTLYPKILRDIRGAQLANGMIPDIAPEYVAFGGGFRDSPEWGSAGIIIPYELYQWYGDIAVLQENYQTMEKYVAYLKSMAVNGIIDYGLGDWFDFGPKQPGEAQLTSNELTATATYYYNLTSMAKIATLLDKADDATKYQAEAETIKTAFNKRFYNAETHVYEQGSQTAFAMPLDLGLVPEADRKLVVDQMVQAIEKSNYSLTAGDIGFHYLVSALQKAGRSDILYKMNSRNDVPGYGYQLAKGATALTESWPALRNVSNNHFMLGHLMEWFYNGLGGIKQEEGSTAFKKIVIKPEFIQDLSYVNSSYHSIQGKIVSNWKRTATGIVMEVEIPANTTAKVTVPTSDHLKVSLNNSSKTSFIGLEDNKGVLALGSGMYRISIKN
jgi:alpha-L-rhamnosidase